jgi:formylglycine-generating enzyme required for sulfatase activity
VPARFWSVVALWLVVGAAPAAEPLAWRLKDNDQFYADWSFLQMARTRVNDAQSGSMEDARVVSHFRVLRADPSGGLVVEQRIAQVQCHAMGKHLPALPAKLEGAVLRVTLDAQMNVRKIEGLEELANGLVAVHAGAADVAATREHLESQARFWLENVFYPLPGRVVARGESWRRDSSRPLAGIGTERRQETFTLAGKQDDCGRSLERITFTGVSRIAYEGPEEAGILNRRPRPELKRQEQQGTLAYDAAAGRLAGGEAHGWYEAAGTGRVRGQDVELAFQVHWQTTLRLSERDPLAEVARKGPDVSPAGGAEAQETPQAPARELTNSVGMKLVRIPAGTFTMGSPTSQAGRIPWEEEHEVEITRPLWMGSREVTIGQFRRFVEATGYRTEAEKTGRGGFGYQKEGGKLEMSPRFSWRHPGWDVTDEHAVVNLSWNDCKAFCTWLGKVEGRVYRLPTEAEWEYACRAGTRTRYHAGDDPDALAKVANVADAAAGKLFPQWRVSAGDDGFAFTAPVGRCKPNAFGLYDMHGNALEWCEDWLWYFNPRDRKDPKGPPFGLLRVQRGGSWADPPLQCTSSARVGFPPEGWCISSGFRVVTEISER